jgi:hypothetical protein
MPYFSIGLGEVLVYEPLILLRELEGGRDTELHEKGRSVKPDTPDLFERQFLKVNVNIPAGDKRRRHRDEGLLETKSVQLRVG